jgi:hypothetical protein
MLMYLHAVRVSSQVDGKEISPSKVKRPDGSVSSKSVVEVIAASASTGIELKRMYVDYERLVRYLKDDIALAVAAATSRIGNRVHRRSLTDQNRDELQRKETPKVVSSWILAKLEMEVDDEGNRVLHLLPPVHANQNASALASQRAKTAHNMRATSALAPSISSGVGGGTPSGGTGAGSGTSNSTQQSGGVVALSSQKSMRRGSAGTPGTITPVIMSPHPFELNISTLPLLGPVILTPRRNQRRRGTLSDMKDLHMEYVRERLRLRASIRDAEAYAGNLHDSVEAIEKNTVSPSKSYDQDHS